jgi:hypothetical protein
MSAKIEFNQTSTLRLMSVLCLCISDLCLIKDRWRYFFLFFLLMISIELFRAKLYKALLHHHETTIRIEKSEALKEHTANLASIQKSSK